MKHNLLFIHGFRGNGLGLKDLAENYFPKRSYNVFIPDIPPAGGNTLKEYSARFYARFIANYIKKNQIEKPILIGHSMGSIVAAAVAERYPELINEKIIFLAPISVKPAKPFAMLTPLTAVLPNKTIGYITTKYLFIPKDKNLFKQTLQTTYLCGADYTTKNDVFRSGKFSASCSIDDYEFKKKACFISGEKDRLIPREKTEKIAQKLNAKNVYIENSGHLLNYENPAATADAIKKFIKEK